MTVNVTITGYSGFAAAPVVIVPAARTAPGAPEPQGGNKRPALRLVDADS